MEKHLIEPDSPEEYEVKCEHCKGTGKDPDYDVDEHGKPTENNEPCNHCKGHGVTLISAEEYYQEQLEHWADIDRD